MAYKLIYNGGSSLVEGNFYPFLNKIQSTVVNGNGNTSNTWHTEDVAIGTTNCSIPTISDGTIISSSVTVGASGTMPNVGTVVSAASIISYIVLGPFNFSNFSSINIEVKSVTNSTNNLANVKIGYTNSLPTTSTGVSFTGGASLVEVPQTTTTLSYDISEVFGINYIVI